jgi:hypothetical protein
MEFNLVRVLSSSPEPLDGCQVMFKWLCCKFYDNETESNDGTLESVVIHQMVSIHNFLGIYEVRSVTNADERMWESCLEQEWEIVKILEPYPHDVLGDEKMVKCKSLWHLHRKFWYIMKFVLLESEHKILLLFFMRYIGWKLNMGRKRKRY